MSHLVGNPEDRLTRINSVSDIFNIFFHVGTEHLLLDLAALILVVRRSSTVADTVLYIASPDSPPTDVSV